MTIDRTSDIQKKWFKKMTTRQLRDAWRSLNNEWHRNVWGPSDRYSQTLTRKCETRREWIRAELQARHVDVPAWDNPGVPSA